MESSLTILRRKINLFIIFFITGLVISGLTAFPLESELRMVHATCKSLFGSDHHLTSWINYVYTGIKKTNEQFPYVAYGTDWLAFAHLIIAVAFIGPLKDPIKNIWVIEFGMIACIAIIPLAFIAGPIRGIPIYWRLVDISFGIIGIVPLLYCHRLIRKYEKLSYQNQLQRALPCSLGGIEN